LNVYWAGLGIAIVIGMAGQTWNSAGVRSAVRVAFGCKDLLAGISIWRWPSPN